MMDKRPAELASIKKVSQFLCNEYPNFFGISEYTHPVKGVCTTLIMKKGQEVHVDVSNIDSVQFDFDHNFLLVKTNSPQKAFMFKDFIKDETVV